MEKIEEDELTAKRELLRTEILDKNYDQNEFIEFCLNKKENGDDLGNWTLSELTEVIKEFINKTKEKNENNSEKTNTSLNQTEGNQEEIKKENIEKMESMNVK